MFVWTFVICVTVACAIGVGLVGCQGQTAGGVQGNDRASRPTRVLILAAASTSDAIEEIVRRFESAHQGNEREVRAGRGFRAEVRLSTGPSSGLAQQILSGAPADLFLSANTRWSELIMDRGLGECSVELLTNRMVLIVPKGNPAKVRSLADLTTPRVTRVAVAGESVPAGIYAEQALRHADVFDALKESRKLARGSDVRAALAYVERGEAEAGIVYSTDARLSDRVEVVSQIDPKSHEPVIYSLVLLKPEGPTRAGVAFYQFLQTEEAASVFSAHGFAIPNP